MAKESPAKLAGAALRALKELAKRLKKDKSAPTSLKKSPAKKKVTKKAPTKLGRAAVKAAGLIARRVKTKK